MLRSLLLNSNLLHTTLYFEAILCNTVTYYFEIKVTSNILYILDITFTQSCIHIYQVNFKNETSLASMQNFSKIKVTNTVLHGKNEIMSVFPPIARTLPSSLLCYSRMPFFHMKLKHETKLKCKRNVVLYNPCDLNDAH